MRICTRKDVQTADNVAADVVDSEPKASWLDDLFETKVDSATPARTPWIAHEGKRSQMYSEGEASSTICVPSTRKQKRECFLIPSMAAPNDAGTMEKRCMITGPSNDTLITGGAMQTPLVRDLARCAMLIREFRAEAEEAMDLSMDNVKYTAARARRVSPWWRQTRLRRATRTRMTSSTLPTSGSVIARLASCRLPDSSQASQIHSHRRIRLL